MLHREHIMLRVAPSNPHGAKQAEIVHMQQILKRIRALGKSKAEGDSKK